MRMDDSPTREAVMPLLRGRFGHEYVYAKSTPSTQRLLPAAAPEGAVAVADEQTEGRGRLGRHWQAPAASSVLCSVQLRPPVDASRFPQLTVVGAEACRDAIQAVTGVETELKAPNDVLAAGRKVAGVLGEASDGRVVLGIGINVNLSAEELPEDVRTPATSLLVETGREIDRRRLLAALLEALEQRYDEWLGA
jgi:BirA family transcriptional regulator, biotin operon repressor / biotin---[acetyl-CoA-carboxylase] ligase